MDKEEIEIHDTSQSETYMDGATSIQCIKSSIYSALQNLGLNEEQVEFIIAKHKDFLNKPNILGKRLKISQDLAERALEIFKSSKQQQLTNEEVEKIQTIVKENPDVNDPEDIALLCTVEKCLVLKYFEMQPLNEAQKILIGEKYNMGNNINEISEITKISTIKIERYIQSTFLTFWGEEGKKVLGIMNNLIGDTSEISLRHKIRSRDLNLQNQFVSMQHTHKHDYQCVEKYFIRYEEGRDFLNIQKDLDIDDIIKIKTCRKDTVELLSPKLNKPESIISKYFHQYFILPVESKHFQEIQDIEIFELSKTFEKKNISLEDYRTIITCPYDDIIRRIEAGKKPKKIKKLIFELLPLIFYYLKCNLSFEDLAQTIYNISKISITAHALFHIIFQLSESVLRGLCIEHYSFSNTVPLYYPKLKNLSESSEIQFGVCKELWYCLEQYNGLISFGLGRASWNPVGKSTLLDTMFDTDFVKGSPQSSAFHYRSIDIQITKNLFGETQQNLESTKWAYIDCHSHSNLNIIQKMCSHLDVALIHVCSNDYNRNRSEIERELRILKSKLKHIYIFIRDCECKDVEISNELFDGEPQTIVSIPDLTIKEMKYWRKSLKQIGHDIFHLNIESPQLIESQFILDLFKASDSPVAKDLEKDQQLIRSITEMLDESSIIQYNFLNYYPSFIEFMSSYHQTSHDQENADKHSLNCEMMDKKLRSTKMGKIVKYFNDILKEENSTLILFKLSKKISHISKVVNSRRKRCDEIVIKEKNDNYTIEVLWRESLLFHKYAEDSTDQLYKKIFTSNYSNHVGNGEAFELIDGDNLRFFNKEIDTLLSQYYVSQNELLAEINKGKSIQIKPAPIVISILGPQSSGKSTLLNYCFGCKFLTSAGRCTRGIYASLSKLNKPVNLSQSFLILDTEGLDAIERENIQDTSKINFDKTMVLFCFSVSQVVIINVKGDIGSEIQNLLQICAYSLNRLKVNKVKAPKIFFVLNQQADPDPSKHLNSMHLLMDKLSSDSLMEAEGVKISDLIQISSKNLFVLPLAFNSQQMNDTSGRLFDSDVIKLSTTPSFANKCTKLRLAIINQLDHMSLDDRAPYQNMSEWMEMAGVIWDTIIEYQDVFKCRISEELKCSNKLHQIVEELMEEHFYSHQNELDILTVSICDEIKSIKSYVDPNILLTEKMIKFDQLFMNYQCLCLGDFTKKCQNDPFLKKMSVICEERAWNFKRLIYVVKTQYVNQIKMYVKLALAEINLTENMKKFKLTTTKNVEQYLNLSKQELEVAFQKNWESIFSKKDLEEENQEREEDFSNLYSIFKMEYNSMEEEEAISQLFRKHKFDMDELIESLRGDIYAKFINDSPNQAEPFINTLTGYHTPIRDMAPYNGGSKYTYLSPNSFYETHTSYSNSKLCTVTKLKSHNWVPTRCEGLLQYCSGFYSHPDIIWNPKKSIQVNRLKSLLRDDEKLPIWKGFIRDICEVSKLLSPDSDVSSAVVKRLIHDFCLRIKILNYEIGYIHACLSNFAERALSTLVFAHAFKNRRIHTNKIKRENRQKKETKKRDLLHYFKQKIEDHKMICGNWDREWMTNRDEEISKKYALDFIESVKRSLKTSEQQNRMNLLEYTCRKESLSHESMLFLALERVREEVKKAPGKKVTDTNNLVIQYICNRNEILQEIFREKWDVVEAELKQNISNHMKSDFIIKISNLNEVLNALILNLESQKINKDFDSDNYFKLIEHDKNFTETKEIPYKAMSIYFRKYLDPAVSEEDFTKFLLDVFEVDGIQVKVCETYTLPCKHSEPILNEDTFSKLVDTEMFNETELIFNIYNFVKHFQSILKGYSFDLNPYDFQEIILNLKKEFEKNVIGCSSHCPSCGKLCEREIHTNEGKCQIKTGHQISSMGGNVWNADESNTAVLFICDNYKEHTQINLSGNSLTWGEFKNICGSEWDWNLPNEEKYKCKQQENPQLMKDVWNNYGDGILKYLNAKHKTAITFVPYTTFEQINEPLFPINYYICFVIDGTGSMNIDIARVIVSVGQLISSFISQGNSSQFRVVVYRDHCDENIIETFPSTNDFTPQQNTVEDFLSNIKTTGGGDFPEAVLDGLATAASQSDWRRAPGIKNKIIHIFDAPPHGDFPDYESHKSFSNQKSCCCCNRNTICKFDWERDVWNKFKEYNIEYHPINTTPSKLEIKTFKDFKKAIKKKLLEYRHWITIDLIFSNYESKMREELGHLCGNYQVVGKEVVNDAILKIFVDRKEDGETNEFSVSFRFDSLSLV